MEPIKTLLAILACYRLSHLISLEEGPYEVFDKIRRFFGRRAIGSYFWADVAEGLHCPFCLGVWFAVPLALLMGPKDLSEFFLYWLGIAGGQAFLEGLNNATE